MSLDLSLNQRISPRRRERATLADVASLAGVSSMAVSSVLNGARSSTRVAQATRLRIQEAAVRLGYQPNAVARSLAAKRTNIIGLYTGTGSLSAETLFGAAILTGMQKGCAEIGRDLLLHGRFADNNRWSVSYSDLSDGRLDGVLLLANPTTPLVTELTGSSLPLVAMVDAIPGVPSVLADEEQGAALLVDHLLQRGFRRIMWRDGGEKQAESVRRRLKGLKAACAEQRVDLVIGDFGVAPRPFTARERGLLDHSGKTAVVCFADYVCDALVADAEKLGRSVPDDLAITGFDGVAMVHAPRPLRRVTTVRCGWIQVAWKAVLALDQCIAGKALPAQALVPVRLEVGDTT